MDRFVDPAEFEPELNDRTLRPQLLADYIGQPRVKEQLGLFIDAARGRQDWVKRRSPMSSPTRWAHRCAQPRGRSWKSRVTWRRC